MATVRSTVPAEAAGEIAVSSVEDTTMNDVAEALPNLTEEASVRAVPVMVTSVPPAIGPLVGVIELITGTAM